MEKKLALIEKIEATAAGERAAGNHIAAATFEAKAEKLRRKYNIPSATPAAKPQDTRAEVTSWLESIPPEAEVVVDDPVGGMQRTMPIGIVLSRLKSGELLLIRMGRGFEKYWKGSFKEYAFVVQEVADQPLQGDSQWKPFYI
jgi:hypothetical protein